MLKCCGECRKKLTIIEKELGVCKCNKSFCISHRLPESHACPFGYRNEAMHQSVPDAVIGDKMESRV